MTDEHAILHEERGQRGAFFIEENGRRIAELTYRRTSPTLVNIDHTEVADSLKGLGVGRKLLAAAVLWARETHTQFTATCSFAANRFARDKSIRDVLSPDAVAAPDAPSCEIKFPKG